MGTCWNCDIQVSLQDDQTNCDNCNEIIFYKCNDCKQDFEILDKKQKKKLDECKFCGYFKCPHCNICSWNCDKYDWEKDILKMFIPEINQNNCPSLLGKVRDIIDYFEDIKISTNRMNCPERGVPISYAKNRIKSLLAKVEGFRVRDEEDRNIFIKRMNELGDLPLGSEKTVSSTREKGSYGQEYRDAFNLLVCLGKFEIRKKKNKEGEGYICFVRCQKEGCKFLAQQDLIITYCENCKKKFPRGIKYCDVCPSYSKGQNEGEFRKLKERLSNKDTCQCYRGAFKNNK